MWRVFPAFAVVGYAVIVVQYFKTNPQFPAIMIAVGLAAVLSAAFVKSMS